MRINPRSIVAVLVGLVVGSIVNMGLIELGYRLIPPPKGFDASTMETLKASMPLLEPRNFVFPFLGHALGTLVGAAVAALMAVDRKMRVAYIVGFAFLIGGAIMVASMPAPMWFNVLDLVGAYIPMAWLGGSLALKRA